MGRVPNRNSRAPLWSSNRQARLPTSGAKRRLSKTPPRGTRKVARCWPARADLRTSEVGGALKSDLPPTDPSQAPRLHSAQAGASGASGWAQLSIGVDWPAPSDQNTGSRSEESGRESSPNSPPHLTRLSRITEFWLTLKSSPAPPPAPQNCPQRISRRSHRRTHTPCIGLNAIPNLVRPHS